MENFLKKIFFTEINLKLFLLQNNYDSSEDQINASTDSLTSSSSSSAHDFTKDNDDLIDIPDKTSTKFKKFLYKKLHKSKGKHHNLEPPEHIAHKSNNLPSLINDRWRRLPLYNLRRIQITQADSDWLKELEKESQTNDDDYI